VRTPWLRQRDSRLTALVDACYPAASRRSSEEGRVVIRVDVDATGRTSAWNLAEGSGFARLDAAVACVIRRLEFTPGWHDGAAVASSVVLPIVYRLH
jgi:protein TonB